MRVGMIRLYNKRAGLALFAFIFALFVLPTTRAAFPTYGLTFEPNNDDSAVWTLSLLSQPLGPTHIYGNFSLRLVDPVDVNYVEFRVGDINNSETSSYLPLVFNATSEPFGWNFSTLDFPIGVHTIDITAFNTEDNGVHYHGVTMTFFFEYQDKSADQIMYTGASLTIVIAGICIVGFVSYELFKRHSSRTRSP
jgi:hypothetical protein